MLIGIDPGLKGAIAYMSITSTATMVRSRPTPVLPGPKPTYDLGAMLDILEGLEQPGCYAFLEKLQALPPAMGGSQANYQRGRSLGLWEMALVASKIPYTLVAPRVWQKVMHAGTSGDDLKLKSIQAAQRLFPGANLLRSERCRVPSDGLAEALLLAEYGRRTMTVAAS